jgi:hypothetical protein
LPLVSLIHAVAVFQVFGKCRCNVTPHNAQWCLLGTACGAVRTCGCFQLLHHRLHELQNTVVTEANIQDSPEQWDIPANIQYTFLVGWDWVSWYCGHYWPIVPAPDDRWWWLWRNWWNKDWQRKPKYLENTYFCPPQIPLD